MPKSKRARPVYLHGPKKKTREDKESLITNVRASLEKYQYAYVLEVKNMRNTYLKDVRQEFSNDGRIFFGKTTLLSLSLGTSEATAPLPGLHQLSPYLAVRRISQHRQSNPSSDAIQSQTCLLLTTRPPDQVRELFSTFHPFDFARAGTKATGDFRIPQGQVYAPASASGKDDDTGEEVVPVAATREPELRKLGVPTRLVKGKVGLETEEESGYVVCRVGQTLDSRQTALLKFFGQKMAVFEVVVKAYWTGATGSVEAVDAADAGVMEVDGEDELEE